MSMEIDLGKMAGTEHVEFAKHHKPDRQTATEKSVGDLPAPAKDDTGREAIIRKVENPQLFTILTIPEAADYFEVRPRTIHRWVDEGKLSSGARRGSITIESIRRWKKKRSRNRRTL